MKPHVPSRIESLDVVRGFAVGGILLANVLTFFGVFLMPPDRAAALSTAAIDRIVVVAQHILIEGKFYSIFSLLFGIGFGLQLAKGADVAAPRFRRRLRVLLGIGAAHALFLWAGDILMLYALLGLTLPWFARRTDTQLLRWTGGLLATPTALYLLALGIWSLIPAAPPVPPATDAAATVDAGVPAFLLERFERMGTGGVTDAFIGNLILLAGRWADLFATMRFPKVLGMFVLGLWLVRQGIAVRPPDHSRLLTRWMAIGWTVGLPANVIAAWALARWGYLPPSMGGALGVAAQAIGFPLLGLAYACTVALISLRARSLVRAFAPLGRMALTNYLMHSAICVVLSYGFGFGLWWRIGASAALAIAIIVVAIQIPLSAWWLSRFRFGPAEWIWRRLTYQHAITNRIHTEE